MFFDIKASHALYSQEKIHFIVLTCIKSTITTTNEHILKTVTKDVFCC